MHHRALPSHLRFLSLTALAALITFVPGCDRREQQARADTLRALTDRQLELTTTFSTQKDSLMRALFESDSLLTRIDSQIRSVKGLSPRKRVQRKYESPLEEQLVRRKELVGHVAALVQRTKATAAQLAESRQREQDLKGQNATLQQRVDDDQKIIADLGEKAQNQAATIATLELRVDSLIAETRLIGEKYYRAYYIVGTERELLDKGVVEREGGANLIFARVGRTLQPARRLDPELFTVIDRREVREIPVPDSTRQYLLISRQSLDEAEVAERDKAKFRGNLRIEAVEDFWAPSRFLILVER